MRIMIFATFILTAFITGKADAGDIYRILSSWHSETKESQPLALFQKSMIKGFPDDLFLTFEPNTVPTNRQFHAVALGIFDLLFTQASYHSDSVPASLLLETFSVSPNVLRQTGFWQSLDNYYNKHGLKLLSVINTGNGYHLLLRETPKSCDLESNRISVARPFRQFVVSMDGLPVAQTITSRENTFKRPDIDGFLVPIKNHSTSYWSKSTRFRTQSAFGSVTYLILINLDRWKDIPTNNQEKILTIGASLETQVYDTRKKRLGVYEADFQKKNIVPIDFCATDPNSLQKTFTRTILQISSIQEPGLTDKFRQLIRSISNQ